MKVNFGRPIVTNEDGDTLFPNYFGEDLLSLLLLLLLHRVLNSGVLWLQLLTSGE